MIKTKCAFCKEELLVKEKYFKYKIKANPKHNFIHKKCIGGHNRYNYT